MQIFFDNVKFLNTISFYMLYSSVEDRVLDPRPGQTKDIKTGICCFSAFHAAFRSKSKYWSTESQNNVSCLPADCCFRVLAH